MTTQTHFRTCNLCEAMCGLEIKYAGQQILSIKGDKADPFSQGHICPKATALADIYHDPDRLKRPVRRTGDGRWEEISWDDAFDEVIANIIAVQQKHGRDSVAIYSGNPTVHNPGSILYAPPFVRALRTKNRFSATSADQLPHQFAAYLMFGHQLLLPLPDIDRTQFMLILGANPLVSNGSIMTAPGVKRRLQAIQARGGRVVVVDPRRTETAALADQHLFIKPGHDVLLLLSLLHVVFADGLVRPNPLLDISDGLAQVEALVKSYSPERTAPHTGIAPETLRQLAHDFCAAESAVCYGRMGASTQAFGGLNHWLINLLNLLTGNLDSAGGAMFTTPAFDIVGLTGAMGATGGFGRWHSRVRGLPEAGGELPVATLAEEILTEGEGQIKLLITSAGNPVLSTPNGRQLDEALATLDFMAAIDIYINETTRHANIILPPTTGLETEHYDLIFHLLAVRNTAKYSPALFEPAEGAMHDWEIFRELRLRLEADYARVGLITKAPPPKLDFFKRMTPTQVIDLALRYGPYGLQGDKSAAEQQGNGLKLPTLKRVPHGLDLGPLRPCLKRRLFTNNRRIHAAPAIITADLERVESTFFSANGQPNGHDLALIGRRDLRTNNSWMHNSERLVKGRNRCTLIIHPQDADSRDIVDGQLVTVQSRVGSIQLPAEVSDEIMPGVVSMPHGWGHGRKGVQMEMAAAHPGVSINDLTDELALDLLTGNAAFNGIPVAVYPH